VKKTQQKNSMDYFTLELCCTLRHGEITKTGSGDRRGA
jgi:hypothetical protein